MSKSYIKDICLPWMKRPYTHPVTGKDLDIGTPDYEEMIKRCDDMINFDLLELTQIDGRTISVSPIVAFLSVAFVSQYTGSEIHHPYKKLYKDKTTPGDELLDNFDFGFVWHRTKDGWKLEPPKGKNNISGSKTQLILISIIGEKELTVNVLFREFARNRWERFAPLGSHQMDPELDQVLADYIKDTTDIPGNYYSPMTCPVAQQETSSDRRDLYCALWSIWLLVYRLKHNKIRERLYEPAVAEALSKTKEYNEFVQEYIDFVNTHKNKIMNSEALNVSKLDHTIDNFLAKEIFQLF